MSSPHKGRLLLAGYVPALILSFVALNQIRLAKTTDMTAWKGGGFGMFSTVDRPRARQVRCNLVGGNNDVPLAIPAELSDLSESVKTNPTGRKMKRLGRRIADTVEDRLPGLETVRVEVWKRTLDLDSGAIKTEKWREAAYRIGATDE